MGARWSCFKRHLRPADAAEQRPLLAGVRPRQAAAGGGSASSHAANMDSEESPRRRRRRGVRSGHDGDDQVPGDPGGGGDREEQVEAHLDELHRGLRDVSRLELPPAALLLLGDMQKLFAELREATYESACPRKVSLEALRGPELSPREHLEWNVACPGGGTLLKMFICMASKPGEVETWVTGRLSISDLGLAFDSGFFAQSEALCTGLIWWSDVVALEVELLHVGGAEVVMAFHEDADVHYPRLRYHMGTVGDAEWLREVWRVCKALQPRRTRRLPTVAAKRSLEEAAAAAMEAMSSEDDAEPSAAPSSEAAAQITDALREVWQELLEKCRVRSGKSSAALALCGSMADWAKFDIFELKRTTDQPLAVVGLSTLASLGLLVELGHSASSVYKVVSAWERGYKTNVSFHNSTHAADVVQSVFHTLATVGLAQLIPPSLSIAMLTSSMIHDIGHPGVDNRFLVATGDALAIRYNDRSPLENMHCATGFEVLRATGVDLLGNIDPSRNVRKHIISMVLGTDMAFHHAGLVELEDVMKRGLSWDDVEMQDVASKVLVHVCDIGNPTRPHSIFEEWSERVMDEFFNQADLEREKNLCFAGSLSRGHLPLDRRKPFNVPHFQLGFAKFVVLPTYDVVGKLPDLDFSERLEHLHHNIQRLQQDSDAYVEEQRKATAKGESAEASAEEPGASQLGAAADFASTDADESSTAGTAP